MSALAMILMAGMAAGDMPGKAMGEAEERLDLCGEWTGTLEFSGNVYQALLTRTQLRIWNRKGRARFDHPFTDESNGNLHLTETPDDLGIYQQVGDSLTICFRKGMRPTTYSASAGHYLLTLHRVKPRKRP